MKLAKFTPYLFCLLFSHYSFAQKAVRLQSPDKQISFLLKLDKAAPTYQVSYKGNQLVNASPLGLSFKDADELLTNLQYGKAVYKTGDENYELFIGKAKKIQSHYNEVSIPFLKSISGEKKQVIFVVRAFDDGLAFRYEFPSQSNWQSYVLTDENTTFNLAQNPTALALFRENYVTSHEGFYTSVPWNDVKEDTLMDMPALFEYPGKIFMAITEASLRNYAGMYLIKHGGVLKSQLSPLPGQTEVKVKAILPHHTPWRVMMITDRLGALLESNILTNLNEPTQIKDLSWLKPGKTTFHWWNGDITPDTTFSPGINFETDKYYIDFCARNHIEYHSVIGYGGIAWYKNDAPGYGEIGQNTDVTQTVPSLDMQQVCDYAKQQGVGIHVWVNWKALFPDLERSFTQFEKWGIKGMMVDFLDRDDQEMVNIQEHILKTAAEHKLFIQFHGAYKPTGMQRTYPNEFTREGTYNYENNKWLPNGISPDHDLNIVFTRVLAGATDYHLGGFRAVSPDKFKTQFTRPLMVGTRCHMLAMYVVLEGYLSMVADYPAAYEGEAGFKFIQDVPTTFDETIVPLAELHKYVTIARRKNEDWYIGTINSTEARTINLPLQFLPPGNYKAEIYSDDTTKDITDPNQLTIVTKSLTNKDSITIDLAAGGGQAIRLIKQP
ncbi:glycoside hydrolase family 97 protein [soil metagenome]